MKAIPPRLLAATACLLSAISARAADRDRIEDADFTKTVTIVFDGTTASVANNAGVTVAYGASTSQISITSAVEGVEYILSGTSASGYVQITSTTAAKVTLNGVSLTSPNGPALSVLSAARAFVILPENTANTLTDSSSYSRSGSGTLHTSGPLIFSGAGALSVTGVKSHAIYGSTYIRCLGGNVTVPAATKDAIHSKTLFRMDHGNLQLTASGDGIDGDSGAVTLNGGSISIRSTVDDTKGIACDGTLTVNGGAVSMTVNGTQSKGMSGKAGIAVHGGSLGFNLAGGVYLETVTTTTGSYTDPSYCTAMKSDGNITIGGGNITVTHTGTAGKGISADGNIAINGGRLDLFTSGGSSASFTDETGATDTASADCLKADGTLSITAGTITAQSTGAGGDCLSSDLALSMIGGTLNLTEEGVSGDCLASDTTLTISGGTLNVTCKGNQSKGMKSTGAMAISGGTLGFTLSGALVLEAVTATTYNPSYCTAIKCDNALTITDGAITITHSGQAGKGISTDGNLTISGGTLNISTSGNASSTFTNTSNATDIAAADCINTDGVLTITGGTITASSTGTAGDAISSDGATMIGIAGVASTPVITASTSGAHVLVTGSGNNADYANAKALSAGGNLTMNGGIYRGTTSTDGGEGMESKANLTINGGTIEITSYDDGINASNSVTINGGTIYCYASGNDGIDSNGTFAFNGGTIVSSGSNSPEEGFDCDQNNFAIKGGVLIGTGGATSTPTAASSTQRTILYKGTGTAGTIIQLKANGVTQWIYKVPRTYSGSGSTPMTMLISLPGLATGTTYTLVSGGTVSGGTEFHGYYTGGATVSGTTTTLKTFTLGSAVGSVTTP